ncbi:MAG: hypothetical protein Q9210_007611, partial [Variospora velana]
FTIYPPNYPFLDDKHRIGCVLHNEHEQDRHSEYLKAIAGLQETIRAQSKAFTATDAINLHWKQQMKNLDEKLSGLDAADDEYFDMT